MSDEYILEMRNIVKEFPGVKALNDVNFKVRRGEIHCLVGENGAGKSTLMKVLSGVWKYGTYTGDIVLDGEVQQFKSIAVRLQSNRVSCSLDQLIRCAFASAMEQRCHLGGMGSGELLRGAVSL